MLLPLSVHQPPIPNQTELPSPPTTTSQPITTKLSKYDGQTMKSCQLGHLSFAPLPSIKVWAHRPPSSLSCSHSSHQSPSVHPFNTPVTIKSMRDLRQWSMTVSLPLSLPLTDRQRDHHHNHHWEYQFRKRKTRHRFPRIRGISSTSSPGTCLSIGVCNILSLLVKFKCSCNICPVQPLNSPTN